MASLAVVQTVEAYLEANWTACEVRSVNSGTEDYSESEMSTQLNPFITVHYTVPNHEQASFGSPGSNTWRETGIVRFVINVRRGSGLLQGLTWAEQLAALFRGKDIDGVVFKAPSSPVIDDLNEEGAYFSMMVAVPYSRDSVG